jgi:hypothetical protein
VFGVSTASGRRHRADDPRQCETAGTAVESRLTRCLKTLTLSFHRSTGQRTAGRQTNTRRRIEIPRLRQRRTLTAGKGRVCSERNAMSWIQQPSETVHVAAKKAHTVSLSRSVVRSVETKATARAVTCAASECKSASRESESGDARSRVTNSDVQGKRRQYSLNEKQERDPIGQFAPTGEEAHGTSVGWIRTMIMPQQFWTSAAAKANEWRAPKRDTRHRQ